MQSFGGPWTLIKLEIVEKYLGFYIQSMKNQRGRFKLCYIDAFAGSGHANLKNIGITKGSALRALDYDFDQYFFMESDPDHAALLRQAIIERKKESKVKMGVADCNELLKTIDSFDWYRNFWRGVIFLDPYAINLRWASLEAIARTKAFDVWYLFPLSVLSRLLKKQGDIPKSTKEKISNLLGSLDWEKALYNESPQCNLFGEEDVERASIENIQKYILERLKTIFPKTGVSEKAKILRIPQNNSPLFLLCFAVSSESIAAQKLSLKVADHILTHT